MSVILVDHYLDFAKISSNFICILEHGYVMQVGLIESLDDELIDQCLTVQLGIFCPDGSNNRIGLRFIYAENQWARTVGRVDDRPRSSNF